MKKTFLKIIAAILTLTVGMMAPLQAYAAYSNTKYVSDVMLSFASTYDEAKADLESKGYKIADKHDLNVSLGQGVYIGYKLTSNRDEAITDLAVMNMNGNYSYTDYENMLKKNREDVDAWVDGIIETIKEFRTNYAAKTVMALKVYEYLNKITEDKSGKGMGDFLLECSIAKDKHDELTDAFMKGNSGLVSSIEMALVLCADSEGSTWLERFSETSYDDLESRFVLGYKTINKAQKAMEAQYGDTAEVILDKWDSLYEILMKVQDEMLITDDGIQYNVIDQDDIDKVEEEEAKKIFTSVNDLEALNDLAMYEKLKSMEYADGGTLLDFFNRPAEYVEIEELYPMVDALSKGQASQIGTTGIRQLIISAAVDNEDIEKQNTEKVDEIIATMDEISLYDGVDLEIYEKGVALTSEATMHESSSTDHWYNAFFSPEHNSEKWSAYFYFYIVPTLVLTVGVVAVTLIQYGLHSMTQVAQEAVKKGSLALEYIFVDVKDAVSDYLYKNSLVKSLMKNYFIAYDYEPLLFAIFKSVVFILWLVMLAVDIYMLIRTILAELDDDVYEDVPHHILDASDARGSVDYVMYRAARTTTDIAADLNGYKSEEGWLVLYYTRDPEAGDPVLADFTVKTGNNSTPTGYRNVHMFGSKDAADLTSKSYTNVSDSANGTYLFFKSSSSTLAGSAITTGTSVISITLGAAAGLLIGILSGRKSVTKKKLKEVDA